MAIIFFIIIAASVVPSFKFNDALTAVATLMAAFVGAKAAFNMQDEKKKNEEIESQCSAVNHTLFLIMTMWNTLNQYRNEVMTPALSTGNPPWLSLKGLLASHYNVNLPNDKMLFLLNSYIDNKYTNHPELYSKLLMEEQRYNLAIGMINELHKMISNRLAPKLESHNYVQGQLVDINILYTQLGPVLFHDVDSLTKGTFEVVDENLESLKTIFKEFREEMLNRFAGIKFIDVRFNS